MLARSFILATALVVFAPAAGAQFTGVVVPPKQDAPAQSDSAAVIAAAQADRKTQLTDMRAWVDSAAAALGVQAAVPDSAAPFPAADSATVTESHGHVARGDMQAGMRAPDTASTLPLVTLLGAVLLSAGTFLVATRRPRTGEATEPARAGGEQHA